MSLASLLPTYVEERKNTAVTFFKIVIAVIAIFAIVSCISNTSFPSWMGLGPSKAELEKEITSLEADVKTAVDANKDLAGQIVLDKDLLKIDKEQEKRQEEAIKAIDKRTETVREVVRTKIKVIESSATLAEHEKDQAVEAEILDAMTAAFKRLPSEQKKDTP